MRALSPRRRLALPRVGMNVSDYAVLGVRRVSVGSILARTAWAAFSTSGVKTSSPSDLALAFAVLATPGLAGSVDSSLY